MRVVKSSSKMLVDPGSGRLHTSPGRFHEFAYDIVIALQIYLTTGT